MPEPLTCGPAPCGSCPYRLDVPSGVWAASEYDSLPRFDGSIAEQALAGAAGVFMCHRQDGRLCAGWLGCHGGDQLLGVRWGVINGRVDPAVVDYRSPVPLHPSGQAACDHGLRELDHPGPAARALIAKLQRDV